MKEKRTLYFAFGVLALLASSVIGSASPAWAERYNDSQFHYGFEVPPGWSPIPEKVLVEAAGAYAERLGISPPEYEAGYQVDPEYNFSYPYFLVQNVPTDDATLTQISTAVGSFSDRKIPSGELVWGEPTVDASRKMVLVSGEAEGEGVGTVRWLTATAPGRGGAVGIHFYSRAAEYQVDLPLFEAVLDSFAFEAGHEYNWGAAVAKSSAVSIALLVVAALGGLAALIAFTMRKKTTE